MIYLGHGASGNAESMKPWISGLIGRDLDARAVALPVKKAEQVTAVYRSQVEHFANAVIGGHSFGGRVASLLAAAETPRALVLLSYPLHRPGHPEQLRTEHWPMISCPVLLLSGESDPFATIARLRDEVAKLRDARLVTYPGVRHGLLPVKDDALAQIADFVRALDQKPSVERQHQ